MGISGLTVVLGGKSRQSSRPWVAPKTGAAEPLRQWSLGLIRTLLKPMPGRKRAAFVMCKNHPHLGVQILTKIFPRHSNGKAKIWNNHPHTLNAMARRIVSKKIQGESIEILDGDDHLMALSASLELVDICTCRITHNERIFPSLQRRALHITTIVAEEHRSFYNQSRPISIPQLNLISFPTNFCSSQNRI
jgi:hypothetical protein